MYCCGGGASGISPTAHRRIAHGLFPASAPGGDVCEPAPPGVGGVGVGANPPPPPNPPPPGAGASGKPPNCPSL
eukprot:30972-Pelagococcus_subviridis.AAC.8